MTCPDLCTAAKCQELENRIGALEQALELLEAAFESHTQQDIPQAHRFNFEIPEPEEPEEPEVSVSVTGRGDGNFLVTVFVGNKSGSDGFTVDFPEPEELEEPEVSVNIASESDNNFSVTVDVGNKSGSDTFTVNVPEIPEPEENDPHVESDLKLTGNYNNNVLTISVADGESSDSIGIFIDTNSSPQTIFITEEVFMNCDQLEDKFDQCCAQILGGLNNLSNQLTNVEFAINQEVKQIYDEVTIDITGTANTDYKCDLPEAQSEGEDEAPALPQFMPTEAIYTGTGLRGIHENLKLINANLDSIFQTTCTEIEGNEVVALVASPKYVTNVEGRVLILHFVNDENYPKRSKGSNYKANQIPGAKESYDWDTDFKDLRWFQGNQYGELELEGYKAKVSGWFADKAAGESFFDAVLGLTTATEKNRSYPDRKVSRTDIVSQIVRPYRAFIGSVNAQGQAVCHVKYVPPVTND